MFNFKGFCVAAFFGILIVGGYFSRQEIRQISIVEMQGSRASRIPASGTLFEEVTIEDAGNTYQRITDRHNNVVCYVIKSASNAISCVSLKAPPQISARH
jgi:hypothetical protein